MRFIKQICFILVHSRDFHDNPFIVKECSIKFPKRNKALFTLRITQFDIFVLNFTFYQSFPGKD